jgi:hypothetical protein
MEVHPRARLPGNPQSKMWLGMEWGGGRSESGCCLQAAEQWKHNIEPAYPVTRLFGKPRA